MCAKSLSMLAVGDIGPRMPNAEWYFAPAAPTLKSADVVVGQFENPYTATLERSFQEMSSSPSDPSTFDALPSAGFTVMTFAGNHLWDWGVSGIEDTIAGLKKCGIACIGAGMNIDEARRPTIIKRNGTRFGFLNYNCVGPWMTYATEGKPGCAFVHTVTAYEVGQHHYPPGSWGKLNTYNFAEPITLKAMAEDVSKLRPLCDVLGVGFHKGTGGTSGALAMHDQQVSYAAIDAGADLIWASHPHILKGIEVYKGKVIFHGLGNFVVPSQTISENAPTYRLKEHTRRHSETFGSDRDPEYLKLYPWHRDSYNTIIAKWTIDKGQISQVSYIPCFINKDAQPEICKHDKRGQQVFDYVDKITRAADLNVKFEWDGDEVAIRLE